MNAKVIVGTGWYADFQGHNNRKASTELYEPTFFQRWFRNIDTYFEPDGVICYRSNCAKPYVYLEHYQASKKENYFSFLNSTTPNHLLYHGHDGLAAIVAGVTFAYLNYAHFVYVEQDCMVHNIDRMIKEHVANRIHLGYGYGPNASFQQGWSEYSLMFVHYEFMPFFLTQMNVKAPFDQRDVLPELALHHIFKDYVTPFRNGHGRLRPLDLDQDWFYAQQLTGDELKLFEELALQTANTKNKVYPSL